MVLLICWTGAVVCTDNLDKMPHLMVRKSNWHAGSDDRSQYFTMVTSSAQDAAIFAGGSVENASSLTPN